MSRHVTKQVRAHITPEQKEVVRAICESLNVTESELVERALREFADRHSFEWPEHSRAVGRPAKNE